MRRSYHKFQFTENIFVVIINNKSYRQFSINRNKYFRRFLKGSIDKRRKEKSMSFCNILFSLKLIQKTYIFHRQIMDTEGEYLLSSFILIVSQSNVESGSILCETEYHAILVLHLSFDNGMVNTQR